MHSLITRGARGRPHGYSSHLVCLSKQWTRVTIHAVESYRIVTACMVLADSGSYCNYRSHHSRTPGFFAVILVHSACLTRLFEHLVSPASSGWRKYLDTPEPLPCMHK